MRLSRGTVAAMAAIVVVLTTSPRGRAVDADVTDVDIHRAVAIATGPRDARSRFHASYFLPIKDPTVERIEVITEFRRFVLASEEQAALGNWMVARGGYDAKGRTLKAMVERWRGQLAIRITVRFHPKHRYTTVPPVDVLPGEPTVLAIDAIRTPLMAFPVDGLPSVMTGAIIETIFNAESFGERTLPVRVVFEGKEIVRVTADFARLE